MPLYEVILQRHDGADEIRFTDHEPQRDRPLTIDGSRWWIERIEAPTHPLALRRYRCVRLDAAPALQRTIGP
jgi:hypothetical protein